MPVEPAPGRGLVLLMAVCGGLSAASLYYAQPLLDSIRHSLHISTVTAGLVVSVTQIGYVTGLALAVPLGDLVARRLLIPGMVLANAGCLILVSVAPTAGFLIAASGAVGVLSVAAQVTVAFSASLASDADRGRTVGTVMSGLLLGILLARTAAGYLAGVGGWRLPFRAAGVALAVLAAVLFRFLPAERPRAGVHYFSALASIPSILADEPVILLRSLYGAAGFGAFNALWTPLAFLLSGSPYRYSTTAIGLFGLLGAVGALTASLAGRYADRGGAPVMTAAFSVALLASWAPMALARQSLLALVGGVIVLDFAVQGLQITNQSEIYRLRPEARSRITSAYMSLYFVGGVAGSVAASAAYSAGGWGASSAVGAGFGLVAVLLWVGRARRGAATSRRRAGPSPGSTGKYSGPMTDGGQEGVLPNHHLLEAIEAGQIDAGRFKIPHENIQPASLDLRLGEVAYRMRCSFLPGQEDVETRMRDLIIDRLDIRGDGVVLETNRPYLIPLKERLDLPTGVRAKANPKSSTGRIDVFTRVITDHSYRFDEIADGYRGHLYLEVVPLSFAVRVREDLSLNQLRLSVGRSELTDAEILACHEQEPLLYVDGRPLPAEQVTLSDGLFLSLDLRGDAGGHVGYRARENAPLLDLTREEAIGPEPFWEPVRREGPDRVVLTEKKFYLLMSEEAVVIPPALASEMTAYDPTSGELRTHYAGFFDPGFGYDTERRFHGSKAALEVRAHDVPFMIEHGQRVCKLTFERMIEEPTILYGPSSNYQRQSGALGKHFLRNREGAPPVLP